LTRLFADELFDEFGTWPLAYIGTGGADYGEIRAVAAAVGDGDAGAYWKAWCDAGDRLAAEADAPHGPEVLKQLPCRYLSIISYPQGSGE